MNKLELLINITMATTTCTCTIAIAIDDPCLNFITDIPVSLKSTHNVDQSDCLPMLDRSIYVLLAPPAADDLRRALLI